MDPRFLNISLRQIRAFVAVAEAGSFTIAAETIHISQPALTLTIQQLERMLGFDLFNRSTRRVVLTVEGEMFLSIAKSLIDSFVTAMTDASALAKSKIGHISVAAVYSIAVGYLPKAVNDFLQTHPDVKVDLVDDNSSGVLWRVKNREADFGFASIGDDPDLDFSLKYSDFLGVAARKGHPIFRKRKELTWDDLKKYEYFGFEQGTGIYAAMEHVDQLPEHIRNPSITVASNPVLEAALLEGNGITVVPALAYPNGLRNGIQFRTLHEPVVTRPIYLVTRHDRPLGLAAQGLLDTLLRYLPDKESSVADRSEA